MRSEQSCGVLNASLVFYRIAILKIIFVEDLCFSVWVFFHEHSRFTGLQGKQQGISLTPLYHFHPLHRHFIKFTKLLNLLILNPFSNLLINCISARSAPQILSKKHECAFLFSNFLIIGLCNSSANSLFDILIFNTTTRSF